MSLDLDTDALQRFETIWEHVECGITIIDAATREILAINPVAARMFGDDINKIIGKKCHKVICPAQECACPILDKGQIVDRSERKFVKANGEIIPIIKSVAQIQYNGRLALLESFTDISNLKAAEERLRVLSVTEQANKAKSDFLSRMSHEMRTPLNAIIGMAKIAENTNDVKKIKYCLSMIGVSSEHLLGLINDILDMAKIEAGKFELESAPLNIEDVFIKICNLNVEKAEEKEIQIGINLPPNMPMRYLGDELRLSQVINNLMSNAVKFTSKGGKVKLSVEEESVGLKSSILRFSISDNGIGMTAAQVKKLFNAFEQADTSISRRFGGTGLGLVISKSIVEKMNGNILVESELGKGSVFTFEVELAHLPKSIANTCKLDSKLSSLNILLVDGDQEAREQFRAMASHFCGCIDEAHSAHAAFLKISSACAAGKPYDLIFTEFCLPDMNAIELTRKLGSKVDKNSFVIMTSFMQWHKVDHEALDEGLHRFVPKPLFPSAIFDAINEFASTESEVSNKPAWNEQEVPDFSQLNVLLAEDVEINREIFISLLEETKLNIDIAENGRIAVEKFSNNPEKYDLLIMDVQMPEMDGYKATEIIRAMPVSKAQTIPIIAMTANVFKADIERCLACGMNDHIPKPIDDKLLIEKIQHYSKK